MKLVSYTATLAACMATVAVPALGADLSPKASALNGQVAVVRAGRAAPLGGATSLQAGDQLIAMENGLAQVKFADGCTIKVEANTVATVGAQSPCAASQLIKSGAPMQLAEGDAWAAPLALAGFAVAYLLVVESIKSDHNIPPIPPLSP